MRCSEGSALGERRARVPTKKDSVVLGAAEVFRGGGEVGGGGEADSRADLVRSRSDCRRDFSARCRAREDSVEVRRVRRVVRVSDCVEMRDSRSLIFEFAASRSDSRVRSFDVCGVRKHRYQTGGG